MNLKKFFCSHDDEILHEFKTDSRLDVMTRHHLATLTRPAEVDELDASYLHVIYFKCNKCKRIRRDKIRT